MGLPTAQSNLTVVVTSGQGGTGYTGIQIAKALGATTVITAATGDGIAFVKALGADVVVDYHNQTLASALADDSVDIVFDNIGVPGTADEMMHAIRSGGTYLVLEGGNQGKISKHPKAGVKQIASGLISPGADEFAALAGWFAQGKLQARTMQPTYTLEQIPEALTRLRGHGVLGKLGIRLS
eukprot:TRINITY_DN27297_c0_g1_i1.p2 TRINITY_DN27297_c0_g1~~TRINITY_DN27297_c0_g1_i1.p2  ORF type:complete len:182 (-),score=34.83 TRINITY_DN27297_c0_g1_i1:86-631(-)